MNREIIFRGKNIYDDEWMYGSLIKLENDRYAVTPSLNNIEIGKSISMYEAYSETVGQFAGITTSGDGDPERIYEHDIVGFVDIDQHVVAEVIFENGSFCFRDKEGQVYYPCDVQCIGLLGNKFDNPRLIKELKRE